MTHKKRSENARNQSLNAKKIPKKDLKPTPHPWYLTFIYKILWTGMFLNISLMRSKISFAYCRQMAEMLGFCNFFRGKFKSGPWKYGPKTTNISCWLLKFTHILVELLSIFNLISLPVKMPGRNAWFLQLFSWKIQKWTKKTTNISCWLLKFTHIFVG